MKSILNALNKWLNCPSDLDAVRERGTAGTIDGLRPIDVNKGYR